MQILLEKSDIDHNKLTKFYIKRTSYELGKLTEPCYYPSLKKDYYDLLNICKLKDQDIKKYVKRFYKGTPAALWLLHKDPITNFHIFIMNYLLVRNDKKTYANAMVYFMIRVYTNLMNKQMKTCSKEAFKYALNSLSSGHLFTREKSIPNAIFYMSTEMIRRYPEDIKNRNLIKITAFIQESRQRISQSVKSFAEIYYDAVAKGLYIKEPYEGDEESGSLEFKTASKIKGDKIINDVLTNICVYKNVDRQALYIAKKKSKIHYETANRMVIQLANLKYREELNFLLNRFIKDIENIDQICGKSFFKNIGNLIRKKKSENIFRDRMIILMDKILKGIRFKDDYDKMNEQNQKNIILFFALYIILLIRIKLCRGN
jgi:hypothetical protein